MEKLWEFEGWKGYDVSESAVGKGGFVLDIDVWGYIFLELWTCYRK